MTYNEKIIAAFEKKFESMLSYLEVHAGESERGNIVSFITSALNGQLEKLREEVKRLKVIPAIKTTKGKWIQLGRNSACDDFLSLISQL